MTRGEIPETPKPADPLFARVRNTVVGGNRLALDAAARAARQLGYRTLILSSTIEGETREIARMHAAIAREIAATGRPARPPACIITGGETTVTIKGDGLGGRNQEFVLAAALEIAGLRTRSRLQRRHRRHRWPHRCRRRHRRRRNPRAANPKRASSSNATIPTTTSSRSAIW